MKRTGTRIQIGVSQDDPEEDETLELLIERVSYRGGPKVQVVPMKGKGILPGQTRKMVQEFKKRFES